MIRRLCALPRLSQLLWGVVLITSLLVADLFGEVILVEDTFSRVGLLNGSAADTGQPWIVDGATWATDGSLLQVTGSSQAVRIGGVNFHPNSTYLLSMELTVTDGGFNWIALGYTSSFFHNSLDLNRGAMLHRQIAEVQLFENGLPASQTIPVSSSFPKELSIQLDIGETLADATLLYRVDGDLVGIPATTDVSTIDGVFIQGLHALGTVDNFKLILVPEPSCQVLALLGPIAFLVRRSSLRIGG